MLTLGGELWNDAELLLCRADSHIDVLHDNADTAMILAAKMNHASVATLLLGAGRSAGVVGEEHSATSVAGHDERH